MEVRNCIKCGKIFNYMSGPRFCPACKDKLEAKFKEVKKYIQENPHATIQEVSEEMEVETRQIHQWIREERLLFSEDSLVTIDCEGCGAAIRTGRYCDDCKFRLTKGFGTLYQTKKEEPDTRIKKKDNDRMRFLN